MFLKVKNNLLDISHVQAVIFDMDGTLVATEHIWAEAKRDIARFLKIDVTDDVLQLYVGRGLNNFIDDVLSSLDLEQRAVLHQKLSEKALSNYNAKLRVIRGSTDILRAFSEAEIRIAICSSGSLQAIKISLEALNATELVEVLVSGDTLIAGKPHPLPYLRTLEELNLDAKNVIAFEDTILGLVSATEAGIQTTIVGQQSDNFNFSRAKLAEPLLENFKLFSG